MSRYYALISFSVASLAAYLISFTPLANFTPQIIAFVSICISFFIFHQKRLPLFFVAFIINLIIFTTGGVNSPAFFLIYFLLLIIAFQNPPLITLCYSTFTIILLSQSLNSLSSLIPLFSLLLITPLVWFIGQQQLENLFLSDVVSKDETEVFLWLSLKFKAGITQIIDSASLLLSDPKFNHSQKIEIHKIKDSAKNLLNSSNNLTQDVSDNDKT